MSSTPTNRPWCIFCKIIRREAPADILYEDDEILCFRDINPASTFHLQTIPKIHIDDATCLNSSHTQLVQKMLIKAKEIVIQNGLSTEDAAFGYHWPPFISVRHLHLHSIAPKSQMNFVGKAKFRGYWFVSPEYVEERIKRKCSIL